MAIDPYLLNYVPGGSIGQNPSPNTVPWETIKAYGFGNSAIFENLGGGTGIQNATPTVPALYGWRVIHAVGDGVSRHIIIDGSVGGLPGFTKIPPMASLFAGVLPAFIAGLAGYWYIETDVRFLTRTIGDANEIYWIMSPSWQMINGVIGASNGFGVVWANTLGANFRLVVADASGVLLHNVDTGVPATVGTHFFVRLEFGFDGATVNMRVLINDLVTPAVLTGPLVLDTVNKLGAFNQNVTVGGLKGQASGVNGFDVMFGCLAGIRRGRIS